MKSISFTTLAFAILIAAFIAIASYIQSADAGGYFVAPALNATISRTIAVGPSSNVRIAASSSRAYLRVARETFNAPVYCNANGDKIATSTAASFRLSTTTGESYEFTIDKNPYDGSVRCYASATTSLLVFELKRR